MVETAFGVNEEAAVPAAADSDEREFWSKLTLPAATRSKNEIGVALLSIFSANWSLCELFLYFSPEST